MRKIAIAICLVAVLFGACGKDDNPAVDAGPTASAKIEVTAKDYAFANAPTTVDVPTLARLTLKNEGTEDHEAALLKLADTKTVDDAKAYLASQSPSGPPPFSVAGGVTATAPGTTATITQALPAGNYAFICFIPDRTGVPHFAKGMLQGFAVTGASTSSLPLPDGENATGTEYAFDLPALKAGTTTIRFKNAGADDHVLGIAKVADGKNANDALKWLTDHQGPPPLTFLGGPAAGPGGTTATTFKFEKGTYVFYCPVPVRGDPARTEHFKKGMFQGVTIS